MSEIRYRVSNCPLCSKSHIFTVEFEPTEVFKMVISGTDSGISQKSQLKDVSLTCPTTGKTFIASIRFDGEDNVGNVREKRVD